MLRGAGPRRTGLICLLVAGLGFVAAATILVPWGPVPGGLGDLVTSQSAFTADEITRAQDYARVARWWGWASLAVMLLCVALVGLTRVGPAVVARLRGPWWWRSIVAVAGLVALETLVTIGFRVASWQRRLDYGLSTQDGAQFASDLVLGALVELVGLSVVVLVLVGAARRLPTLWPAVAGVALGAIVLVSSYAYPVVVEPLFNDFTSLEEGELRTEITRVAGTEGIDLDDVVVADASRRTTTLNAWVSGLGSTRRVVLYDNLVDDVPVDQTVTIVAHELAHARHQDVLVGTALGALGAMAAVGALGVLSPRRRTGGIARPEAVPLIFALVVLGGQLASPLQNGISRQVELRADVEALCLSDDPEAFSQVQRELARRSLSDPTPPAWSQWWWGSHPGVLKRLTLAEQWQGLDDESRHEWCD